MTTLPMKTCTMTANGSSPGREATGATAVVRATLAPGTDSSDWRPNRVDTRTPYLGSIRSEGPPRAPEGNRREARERIARPRHAHTKPALGERPRGSGDLPALSRKELPGSTCARTDHSRHSRASLPLSGGLPPLSHEELRRRSRAQSIPSCHSRGSGDPPEPRGQESFHARRAGAGGRDPGRCGPRRGVGRRAGDVGKRAGRRVLDAGGAVHHPGSRSHRSGCRVPVHGPAPRGARDPDAGVAEKPARHGGRAAGTAGLEARRAGPPRVDAPAEPPKGAVGGPHAGH